MSNHAVDLESVSIAWDPAPLVEGALFQEQDTDGSHADQTLDIETELLMAREAAKDSGFQQGFEEGFNKGLSEGERSGFEAGQQRAYEESKSIFFEQRRQIQFLINQFEQDLNQKRELIAADLLELCLQISQAIIKQSLKIKPELILALIQDLINLYPPVEMPGTLHLNPSDAKLLTQHIQEDIFERNWRITEDNELSPGECRLDTQSNIIDARLSARWQHLNNALNQSNDWLP